jgi:trehalose 6-phosphate phosphatase
MIKYKCRGGFAPMSFSDMVPFFSDQPRFIILDRDGTLVPYSPTPELAFLPPLTKTVLCDLVDQNQGQVAIVSARGLQGLQDEFDSNRQILAGNYGLEISFPSGRTFVHPAAKAALPQITELAAELAVVVARYPQLILDNHTYSLCLHYHLLPAHQCSHVAALIEELAKRFPSLTFRALPTSYEIVPPVEWNKGSALERIADELKLQSENTLYVVFGDTEADEPMYQWVNAHRGLSFNVGERDESQALGRLDSADDVYKFLRNMLDLKTQAEPQSLVVPAQNALP